MSLRARLILALMALALIPTAIFTAFTLDQLGRSTDRWFRPGVDRALESGVEVSKTALTRMETTVLALADACATRVAAAAPAERRRVTETMLDGSGVDLVQFYRREPAGWRLTEQVVPEGLLIPQALDFSEQMEGALLSTRIVRSDVGALAAVSPLGAHEAVAASMWVPPSFFSDMDSVGVALGYYRQLAVVVDVQRRFVWLIVALLSVALIALAFLLATVLARQMSRPLLQMSEALTRVAGGDLDVRVTATGAREVRSLGDAFNAMTGRLAEARSQLKEAEREAAWREVARRLAHEFKNMLTPMSLSLYRLQRRAEAVVPEQRAAVTESLESLERGVDQLTRLAEQFAQYARLPDPRFESIDLTEVAETATRMHEHEGVEITFDVGPWLPVRGDVLLLSRAIHNLVLNACEAGANGSKVEVRTRKENGRAVLEVLDRGPGIPEETLEHVFDPYISTKKRGSGLGLSLVKDIAGQHEGVAGIENRDGGGARAWFELPLRDTDPRTESKGP